MKQIEPLDVIIFVIIMGCITSISFGRDGIFKDILITVMGYYIGRKSDKIKP